MPHKNGDLKYYEISKYSIEFIELILKHYTEHNSFTACELCKFFVSFMNENNLMISHRNGFNCIVKVIP